MHEYLLVINHENKTANDETGIKMIKTVMNEIVKIKREDVWQAYAVIKLSHDKPDMHIRKWIEIILRSLNGGNV